MEDERYLEKVHKYLWTIWGKEEISFDKFASIEENLKRIYKDTKDPKSAWLLSELRMYRINMDKIKAREYARLGLRIDQNSPKLHKNLLLASDGPLEEFEKRNHMDLIDYYYEFINIYPDNILARKTLVDLLVDNYRLKEAKDIIDLSRKYIDEGYFLFEFSLGEIYFLKGYREEAFKMWENICKENKNNWVCYFLTGEKFSKYGMFSDALDYYKKSFEIQKKPRRIDPLIAMAQIYELKEDYIEAYKCLKLNVKILREEYNIEEDDDEILKYVNEKNRLGELAL